MEVHRDVNLVEMPLFPLDTCPLYWLIKKVYILLHDIIRLYILGIGGGL